MSEKLEYPDMKVILKIIIAVFGVITGFTYYVGVGFGLGGLLWYGVRGLVLDSYVTIFFYVVPGIGLVLGVVLWQMFRRPDRQFLQGVHIALIWASLTTILTQIIPIIIS